MRQHVLPLPATEQELYAAWRAQPPLARERTPFALALASPLVRRALELQVRHKKIVRRESR